MIKYKAGYKYQIVEGDSIQTNIHPSEYVDTTFITLTVNGLLSVKDFYAFDGPSGPTFDTPSFMRGSLFHDSLYQLMREGHITGESNRRKADKVLRSVCIADGMWKWRAAWVYRAVRLFAASSSRHVREVKTAP